MQGTIPLLDTGPSEQCRNHQGLVSFMSPPNRTRARHLARVHRAILKRGTFLSHDRCQDST